MFRPSPGPWNDEPSDGAFDHAGFRCRLWRNRLWVWCGYVEVPPSHPCYGEQRGDLQALAVHGGVTYAGEHEDWGGGWWIGFDCSHGADLIPALLAEMPNGTYRTMAYAEANTRALAEQLAMVAARQWV